MKQKRMGMVSCVAAVIAGIALAEGEKPLDLKNAVWAVKLDKVLNGAAMTIHIATVDGKVVQCLGLGAFNKAIHDVDGSGLTVSDAGTKGKVKVVINADQWVPKDKKPIECLFDIEANASNGKLDGKYSGKRGVDEISGAVAGTVCAPPKDRAGKFEIQLERAITGNPNQQRVIVSFEADADGKVGKVSAGPKDAFHWTGKVKEVKLAFSAGALTGDLTVEVENAKSVDPGTYTFTLDGKVVGTAIAGRFKTMKGDKEIRASEMFSGGLK
jgi:hypothetical protein